MLTALYTIQIVLSIMLVLLVFLQKKSEGTGLLSNNSYNAMFGKSGGAYSPLFRVTFVFGLLFFFNSIIIGCYIAQSSSGYNISSEVEKYQSVPNKNSNGDNGSLPSAPLGK